MSYRSTAGQAARVLEDTDVRRRYGRYTEGLRTLPRDVLRVLRRKRASDVARQLAFAAIAVIWLFKKDTPQGQLSIPHDLIFPGFLVLAALAADFLQYEIAPELSGHGLPLSKCEAYNRVYDQPYESR